MTDRLRADASLFPTAHRATVAHALEASTTEHSPQTTQPHCPLCCTERRPTALTRRAPHSYRLRWRDGSDNFYEDDGHALLLDR